MTPREKAVIRAVVKALHVPRNRYGKLDDNRNQAQDMDALALSYGLQHGGLDRVDKATMLLEALVGDVPMSILDDPEMR